MPQLSHRWNKRHFSRLQQTSSSQLLYLSDRYHLFEAYEISYILCTANSKIDPTVSAWVVRCVCSLQWWAKPRWVFGENIHHSLIFFYSTEHDFSLFQQELVGWGLTWLLPVELLCLIYRGIHLMMYSRSFVLIVLVKTSLSSFTDLSPRLVFKRPVKFVALCCWNSSVLKLSTYSNNYGEKFSFVQEP